MGLAETQRSPELGSEDPVEGGVDLGAMRPGFWPSWPRSALRSPSRTYPETARRSGAGFSFSWSSTPSRSFSHSRGTAKKTVGRHSLRSSDTVVRLRANQVSPPMAMGRKSLIIRSAMWESGRNDSSRSPGRISIGVVELRSVHMMLSWVIIVPLGRPVVPLV